MIKTQWVLSSLLVSVSFGQIRINPYCDFYQDVVLGQEYYIYNPEYPNSYPPQTQCRWSANSPPGTVMVLNCDLNIPYSDDCLTDQVVISQVGDPTLQNSRRYCGALSFAIVSQANALTVGLFSGSRTFGGNFICSLAAIRTTPTWCSCSAQINEEKIVGGQETKVNEFPWMAVLLDVSTYDAFCGASIISDRYALTAAHCFRRQTANNLLLLVGDHNLDTGNDTDAAAVYKIFTFITHPLYNDTSFANDIGVVKTTDRIFFSQAVGPVCLPFRYGFQSFENNIVTVLGWGFKDVSGDKSSTLQKVNLNVISNPGCSQSLKQCITPSQLCTYTPGKDSCFSDSGGPLLWKSVQTRLFELVGIVSFGISCAARSPGVNTRITSFLTWIASVTGDAVYCIK